MKKLLTCIMISVFGVGILNAQGADKTLIFGAKAGVNFADITGDEADSFDGRTSFHFGAVVEIPISEKFSFQPELLYSDQGSAYEDITSESVDGFTFTESAKGDIKLGYLNVPLMAKYYVAEGFSIEAGPQIGLLLSAKNDYSYTYTEMYTEGSFTDSESGEEDIKHSIKDIDFGVNFGVGYKLDNGLNFGARYNLGLTDANDDTEYLGNSSYKNSVIQVSVGYFFQ
ncbi:porin family protein [Psychroserpens sp.]|uniref:porin family protein n=1 Tax=Psychroserpens sp. TaxID=2020870 RepID=UPI002B269B69|nr:porin family protein [Psychroserpens sp.]